MAGKANDSAPEPDRRRGYSETEGEWQEWWVTRDKNGRVIKIENTTTTERVPDRRYVPATTDHAVWTWRPRLRIWELRGEMENIYPGKPPHIYRRRVADISKVIAEAERAVARQRESNI